LGELWGWGRHPRVTATELLGEDLAKVADGATLSRGLARSYGDASLPPSGAKALGSRLADRILAFDPETGRIHAEAGLSLQTLNRIFWPRGYSSPILPGTQLITLGGMVAADVHAKNHHVDGTFGRHVERLKILLADGSIVWASRTEHDDLFRATLGGMGLTGHVLEVIFKLHKIPSAWIKSETERIPSLEAYLDALTVAAGRWPMTVGWIDCLTQGRSMGRGHLISGDWAKAEEAPATPPPPKRPLPVPPIDPPSFLLNHFTVGLFNFGYYNKQQRRLHRGIVHPETFFHPLDAVSNWNRLYGRNGFTQYQCVLPERAAVAELLTLITRLGVASFLCVIKDCGPEGEGLLSFPKGGTTLAVDIPVRRETPAHIARLNELVVANQGRVYLAKDTFTTAEHFRAMEPRLDAFLEVRRKYDPQLRLRSLLSRRLFGDP
jgi:decaprenylphospho-beta-D-ribofuranose 2-oxidase